MDQIKAQIIPAMHMIGLALVIVAALKFAGVRIGFGGGVTEPAMVGIGLSLAK